MIQKTALADTLAGDKFYISICPVVSDKRMKIEYVSSVDIANINIIIGLHIYSIIVYL